jgi:hypothetical protein
MSMMDDGVLELMRARRELDKAHKAACAAMARFQSVKSADIMSADERVAARSLLDQTVPLCKAILCAMQAVPDVALPKALRVESMEQGAGRTEQGAGRTEDGGRNTDDRGQKTAAWMLNKRRENRGLVATSARFGKPICAGIH